MRRVRVSWGLGVLAAVAVGFWLVVPPGESQTAPRKGGVLRVGMIGEPPTLDVHSTTAVITREIGVNVDRKSTRLNSSHSQISYAVFCLKKKKKEHNTASM